MEGAGKKVTRGAPVVFKSIAGVGGAVRPNQERSACHVASWVIVAEW